MIDLGIPRIQLDRKTGKPRKTAQAERLHIKRPPLISQLTARFSLSTLHPIPFTARDRTHNPFYININTKITQHFT